MLQTFDTKIIGTAFTFLRTLNIDVTRATLAKNLEENPFFPSLYSLNQVFNRMHIPNASYKLDPGQLKEVPPPFIAYMRNQPAGRDFVAVTESDEKTITYYQDQVKTRVPYEKFIENWERIILLAEKSERSGEEDFQIQIKAEKRGVAQKWLLHTTWILTYLLLALVFLQNKASNGFSPIVLWFLKTLGVLATLPLLAYEIDHKNSLAKQFCNVSHKTNCHAVLSSKAAKIAGFSWSELGFFYFSSTFILLLSSLEWGIITQVLSLGTLLVSPYMLFSIYYQWRVAKQWCTLCLVIQAVLFFEVLSTLFYLNNIDWAPFSLTSWITLFLAALIPPLGWFAVKPLLIGAKKARVYTAAYHRLLYNPDVFYGILDKQRQAVVDPDLGISLGAETPSHHLLKVCNPYCGPCAMAHPILESILERNNTIKLQIMFTATNAPNDAAGIVARHLMAIASFGDSALTRRALDDWYNAPIKSYDVFAQKYPLSPDVLDAQAPAIDKMSKWCQENDIRFTPTLFVDGKQLPDTYSVKELKHLM